MVYPGRPTWTREQVLCQMKSRLSAMGGIEIINSPVNHDWANGCAECTIGSLKNSIMTFVQEKRTEPL